MIDITSKNRNSLRALGAGLGAALLLLGMASCSNEDYLAGHAITDGAGTRLSVKASIVSALWSDTKLPEGAVYGLSVAGYDDATAINKGYVSSATADTCGIPIYIKAATPLAAYYPYTGEEKSDPYESISTLDQSNIKHLFFCKTDEVQKGLTETVKVEMHDIYSQLSLKVNVPADDVAKTYRLLNVGQVATLNLRDGTMNYDETKNDLRGDVIYSSSAKGGVTTAANSASISMILLPADLKADDNVRMIIYGEMRNYLIVFDSLRMAAGELTSGTVDLSVTTPGTYTPDGYSQWDDSQTGGDYKIGSGTVSFDKIAGEWVNSGAGQDAGSTDGLPGISSQWNAASESDSTSVMAGASTDVDNSQHVGGDDDDHPISAGAKTCRIRR